MTEDNILTSWLAEMNCMGVLISSISEILARLKDKRATLEEKIIAQNLYQLSAGYGSALERINLLLFQGKEIPLTVIEELKHLNTQVADACGELLKMIKYDLNFLEQYFEHGFVNRLVEEYRFPEAIGAIVDALKV